MPFFLFLILAWLFWQAIKWSWNYDPKKIAAEQAARNAVAYQNQLRQQQMENLDFLIKLEQLEALRQANSKSPPRRPPWPLEPV